MPCHPTSKHVATLRIHLVRTLKSAVIACSAIISTIATLGCIAPSAGAATTPQAVNNWSRVAQFGSYGNITTNDCTMAAIGALQQVWSASIGGNAAALSASPVLSAYRSLARGGDVGVAPAQAFAAWERGIDGAAIDAVSSIAKSKASIEQAVWQLGGIYAIVNITGNDMQHPNVPTSLTRTIAPWTTTEPTHPGAFAATPHAVAVVGYNAQYVFLATWGSVQPVSWAWWNARSVQSWAVLPDSYFAIGHGPVSDLDTLKNEYFSGHGAAITAGPYVD